MLGKLLAEDIEGLDFSAVESLKASGANKIKTLRICSHTQLCLPFYHSYFIALN